LLWTSCLKFVNESTVPESRVDVGYPPPQGALAMILRCWRGFQLTAILFLLLSSTAFAGNPQWVEVRSPHFSVITDAGEKRGREVAVRFEQMRVAFGKLLTKATVNLPVPLQIIAFRNAKELRQFSPLWHGKPISLAGLFQSGQDRDFILLDLSA